MVHLSPQLPTRSRFYVALENYTTPQIREFVTELSSSYGPADFGAFIADSVYHLSVEIMLSDSTGAYFKLCRIFDQVFKIDNLDGLYSNAALACLCKSALLAPDPITKLLRIPQTDPFLPIDKWVCVCGSACSLGKRLCAGKSPFELGLEALNFEALEKMLSIRAGKLQYMQIFHLYRHREQSAPHERTLETVKKYFPEKDNSVLYACAEIVAILTDGKEGRISAFPVDRVGMLGRTARQELPDLHGSDGRRIAHTVAETGASVLGRDVIFKFLMDMKITVPTDLLESVVFENPDFWKSQSACIDSCPANVITGYNLSAKFLRICTHILSSCDCQCACCLKWNAEKDSLERLAVWLDVVTKNEWTTRIFPGYKLLDLVKSGTDLQNSSECIALAKVANLSSVLDAQGNTVLHFARNIEVLRIAVAQSDSDVIDATNFEGRTPLDCAIVACDLDKVHFLLSEARARLTWVGLERVCELVDGNYPLLNAIKNCIKDIDIEKPKTSLIAEVKKLQHRLAREKASAKRKTAQLDMEVTSLTNEIRHQRVYTEQLENEKKLLKSEIDRISTDYIEQEARECVVCMERRWDTALVCGHCFCIECAESVCKQRCPVCSTPSSSQFIRLFNCR
jgi:hypothetical protein